MRSKWLMIGAALLVAGCLIVNAFAQRPPTEAPTSSAPAVMGHFQMVVNPGPGATNDEVYVLDTQTGHVWRLTVSSGAWKDFGTPPIQSKEK